MSNIIFLNMNKQHASIVWVAFKMGFFSPNTLNILWLISIFTLNWRTKRKHWIYQCNINWLFGHKIVIMRVWIKIINNNLDKYNILVTFDIYLIMEILTFSPKERGKKEGLHMCHCLLWLEGVFGTIAS